MHQRLRGLAAALLAATALSLSGCFFNAAELVFPVLPPNPFDAPPLPPGLLATTEQVVARADLGDGAPGDVTVFAPAPPATPKGVLVWVLGLNNRAYYHQSLQEHLASQGWMVLVPDTRNFRFSDFHYHRRIVDIAKRAYNDAIAGAFGNPPNGFVALGGYSAGATLAAFASGELGAPDALAMWAAADSPFWYGVDPDAALGAIVAPSLFILGELDTVAPADAWPAQMQAQMTQSAQRIEIVPQGVHLFFQEPNQVDDRNPFTTTTREEQMATAIRLTSEFLDERLAATLR